MAIVAILKSHLYILPGRNLDAYVRQHYLRISRQITGADANALGQIAQSYVLEKLKQILGDSWQFERDSSIPGISHTGGETDTTFDIVGISPGGRFFAIEVSFQVTTNNTIERKAGQAQARYKLLHRHKHAIAYVIDGAGNINVRTNAVGIIAIATARWLSQSKKSITSPTLCAHKARGWQQVLGHSQGIQGYRFGHIYTYRIPQLKIGFSVVGV